MYEEPNSSRAFAKITYNAVAFIRYRSVRKFRGRIQRKFWEFLRILRKKKNNFSNVNLNGILMFARVARNIDGYFEDDYFKEAFSMWM